MSRKPRPSAYILALTLRETVRRNEARLQGIKRFKETFNQANIALEDLPPEYRLFVNVPYDPTLFWSDVIKRLDGMKEAAKHLTIIEDTDYRSVVYDAIKQPYHKVRQSKGFQKLVPVLETIRRYGPIDERQPMGMTEDEARDFADFAWAQELENFPNGVDPINKHIIVNKVAKELKEVNIKYIGEEIIAVEFDNEALDDYEVEHEDALKLFGKGVQNAYELFDYDASASTEENTKNMTRAVVMYNCMLGKDMDDEQVGILVHQLLTVFRLWEKYIE